MKGNVNLHLVSITAQCFSILDHLTSYLWSLIEKDYMLADEKRKLQSIEKCTVSVLE